MQTYTVMVGDKIWKHGGRRKTQSFVIEAESRREAVRAALEKAKVLRAEGNINWTPVWAEARESQDEHCDYKTPIGRAVRVSKHLLTKREPDDPDEDEQFHILYDMVGNDIGQYYPESHIMILSHGSQELTAYAVKAVSAWFKIEPSIIDVEYA